MNVYTIFAAAVFAVLKAVGAAVTATGNSASINILEAEGQIAFLLDSAAGTGTGPTLDVKIQHSEDNATWTDVPGAAFQQVGEAASAQKLVFDSNKLKKHVRAAHTVGGTTPSFNFSLTAIYMPKYRG